jgi:rubrerythrin
MIPVAIASFVLLVTVVYLIARPFVAPVSYEAVATLEQLHADRERLRAQLRELDMDFETGKLAREEYEKFHARRLQQIEATTRAIRDAEGVAEPESPAETTTEPAADAPSDADLERELERRIAARKHQLEELEVLACPGCGITIDPDDRFCRKCGADLATAETR